MPEADGSLDSLTLTDVQNLTREQAQEALLLRKDDQKLRYHHWSKIGKALNTKVMQPDPAEIEAEVEVSKAATEVPVRSGAITGRQFLYRCLTHLAASGNAEANFYKIWNGVRKPYQAFLTVNGVMDEMGTETPDRLPTLSELNIDRDSGEPLGDSIFHAPPQQNGITGTQAPTPEAPQNIYDELRAGKSASMPMDGAQGFTEVEVQRFGG